MPYSDPNDLRRLKVDHAYENSERGYVLRNIGSKYNPSRQTKWIPEILKQDFWQLYMNHIQIMKEKFPKTNGRICSYCLKEYSFIRRMGTRGKGYVGQKKQVPTNFSIDRYDTRLTYQYNNIVFCCIGCNQRKRDSVPEDWKNYNRVGKEIGYET